ncbi:TPA: phage holin [Streptococcus suis]
MKLSNKTYDFLKYLVTIFAPALMTLIAGFGATGLLANTETIVTVIGLFATFIGALIGVSSHNYHKED